MKLCLFSQVLNDLRFDASDTTAALIVSLGWLLGHSGIGRAYFLLVIMLG
ncbi:hypothetical protein G7077_02965 [Sphingomonas piscis]|uniref:Uncharacterized protein n=1 Tax=Sphingomonas piscis TaxID=2714943 RepID=A0A6G7YMP6_9SPHN|nr:hypothetical protein [Sphingomonas piscis]QIK78025.1 hypothetical protein G7077_02965 [Sphingomonas piscis]